MANITGALSTISSDLQKISNKLETINISSLEPADQLPKEAGVASVGTSTKYAREDHVHPAPQSAGNADYATEAGNASTLGGKELSYFATNKDITDILDGTLTVAKSADSDLFGGKAPTDYATASSVTDIISGTTPVANASMSDYATEAGKIGKVNISLTGDVVGGIEFDGSKDVTIETTATKVLQHTHPISEVDNLQTQLDYFTSDIATLTTSINDEIARAIAEEDKINKANAADIQKAVTDINKLNDADIKAAKAEIYAEFDKVVDGTTKVKKAEFADMLTTERTISLTGDAEGSVVFGGEKDVAIATTVKQLDHPIKIDVYKNSTKIKEFDINTTENSNNYIDISNSCHIVPSKKSWFKAATIEFTDTSNLNPQYVFDLIGDGSVSYLYRIIIQTKESRISGIELYYTRGSSYNFDFKNIALTYTNNSITIYMYYLESTVTLEGCIDRGKPILTVTQPTESDYLDTLPSGAKYAKYPLNQDINVQCRFLQKLILTCPDRMFLGETDLTELEMVFRDNDASGIPLLELMTHSFDYSSTLDPVLRGVGNPINSNDAANKWYVDHAMSQFASLETRIAALEAALNATSNES